MTGTSFIPLLILIILVARTRKTIRKFRNAGAVSESTAKTLDELHIRHHHHVQRLIRRGIVVQSNARYHLDEDRWADYQNRKRTLLLPLLLLVIVALIVLDIVYW